MSTFRAGFACLVGRPNAGKSTLTNALVGTKVAITSTRPQTTRHAIRGILHRSDAQLVLVDTPGLHRPRTLLGQRLNDIVRTTWSEVDVVGLCIPADQDVGPGDRYIAAELAGLRRRPVLAIVTKIDRVSPNRIAEQLLAVQRLGENSRLDLAEIVPVSAVTGANLSRLADLLVARLPEGHPLYPAGELTDEPEEVLVAELIREAALEGVRDELPHSLAVTVEEMTRSSGSARAPTGPPAESPDGTSQRDERKDVVVIHATVHVERASQKPIVLGAAGSRLKDVGIRARRQIEALLGSRVYLDLHVHVLKDWQRDPRQLRRLGF